MTVVFLINDKFHNILYLDNLIFHSRATRGLSDRNFGCGRRPRYLIFSQFSICCCQNAFASGALPRTPPGASSAPTSWQTLVLNIAEGPTEFRAPGPRDPTIRHWSAPLQARPHSVNYISLDMTTIRWHTIRNIHVINLAAFICWLLFYKLHCTLHVSNNLCMPVVCAWINGGATKHSIGSGVDIYLGH